MNDNNKVAVSPSRPLIGSTAVDRRATSSSSDLSDYANTRSAELELENEFWLEILIAGLRAGILSPYVIRREK